MALIETTRPPEATPAVLHVDSFVSAAHGFVYLCVPKTLSRSMLHYLETLDPAGHRVGRQGKHALEVPAPGGGPLTRFSFVRNPYSRIVAVYFDKFVNYEDSPGQRDLFARHPGLHPDMAFGDLVDWLATDAAADAGLDPHFLPQYYFLHDASGAPAVDLLGRMEDADADVADLQRRLGLEVVPLPRVKSNALHPKAYDTARRWPDVLDDRTTRILTKRYDGDFALLGYEPLPYRVMPLFSFTDRSVAAPARRPTRSERLKRAGRRLLGSVGLEVRRTGNTPTPGRPPGSPS